METVIEHSLKRVTSGTLHALSSFPVSPKHSDLLESEKLRADDYK